MKTELTLLSMLLLAGCGVGDPGQRSTGGASTTVVGGGTTTAQPICTWVRHETQICPNPARRRDVYEASCVAAPSDDCRAVLPQDLDWVTRSDGCEVLVQFDLTSRHTLFAPWNGECGRWLRAWEGLIECYDDLSCGANESCVSDQCHCGATRFPPENRSAATPHCDGNAVMADQKVCAASRTIVTQSHVVEQCDPATGESCATGPQGAFCQGSPPPRP